MLRTLLDALGREGRRRMAALAAVTILGALTEFAMLLALLHLLREWLGTDGGGWSRSAALLFGIAVLLAGLTRFALLTATQRLAFDTGHRLLVAVQRRLLARDWLSHAQAKASGPLAAVEQVDQVSYGIILPILQGGSALVLGVGILAALVRIDALAALAAATLLHGLFVVAVRLCRPALRRAGRGVNEGLEERIAAIQQQSGAMRELILAGAKGAAAERLRSIDQRLSRAKAAISIANGAPRLLVETLGLLALTGLAWWLAERAGGLREAVPTLAALALGAQRLLPLAQTMSNAVTGLTANAPALERLAELLRQPDLSDRPRPEALPLHGEVRLAGVTFTYPGRRTPALDGIDLTIRRGERVALHGRNGSGKSTLADLVMGLLEPGTGRILVDGRELGTDLLPAWQRSVAHVPQAPFLADASIAENIAFMRGEPDHVRVVAAARAVGLHEMIDALPRGYETRVGERALLLSGGQRQRLALARALYEPAPLLVLDEATSALDPETEQQVLSALDELQARGTTILLIAHRPSMLEHCDRVIRLDRGRIVDG